MRHDLFNEKNRSHNINAATAVAAAADDVDDDSNDSSIPKSRKRDSFYKIISFPFTILHAPLFSTRAVIFRIFIRIPSSSRVHFHIFIIDSPRYSWHASFIRAAQSNSIERMEN